MGKIIQIAEILLFSSYFVVLVLGIAGWLSAPRLGLEVETSDTGEAIVVRSHPGGNVWFSGVRAGDTLLEIDGLSFDRSIWELRGDIGSDFRVISAASGAILEGGDIDDSFTGAVVVSLLTISLIFWACAFFLYYRTNRSQEILIASAMFLLGAMSLAIAPATDPWIWWALQTEAVLIVWTAALFFIFFYTRYVRLQDKQLSTRPIAWIIVILALFMNLSYAIGVNFAPFIFDRARQASFTYLFGAFGGGVFFLIFTYVKSVSSIERERLRIMSVGIAAAVIPFLILSIFPTFAGLALYVRPEISILGVVLIPLSFVYAIQRHRFMEIRRLVHRGSAYFFISVFVLLIHGASIFAIEVFVATELSSNLWLQTALLITLFAFIPLVSGVRSAAFSFVDRVLYREYVNIPELTQRVSVDGANIQDIDEIAKSVLGTIVNELRLSFAAFVFTEGDDYSVKVSVGHLPENLADRIKSSNGRISENRGISLHEVDVESSLGSAVLVKLTRGNGISWALCLGPKVNEEPFTGEDLRLAQSVTGQIASTIEKLDVLEELQIKTQELKHLNSRLMKTQEEERGRIASYLHDVPLQELTSILMAEADKGLKPDIAKKLRSVVGNIREFSTNLHPAVLEDLGLIKALEWIGSQSRTSGMKILLDWSDLPPDLDVDSQKEVALALYRIAQESLTNCQKHSKARMVWMRLKYVNSTISLIVEDDGIGSASKDRQQTEEVRLGLIGMRERAEQLGGRFEFQYRSPSGSRVIASLPLDNIRDQN